MEWMNKNIPDDIYTIGTHPMFGPDSGKNGLLGLPVVMCPIKEKDDRYEKVKNLFLSMNLKVIEMTGDEHDRDAAFSQGVTHFVKGNEIGRERDSDKGLYITLGDCGADLP